ncbi:hypothetical protein Q4E93_20135 [Flavitalea sp. BT771]|uniref:hypothetical protein n=1 Tax=Flavitalea sp. BT771 TaxID=3063329 RepID=UPI0026E1B58C|nr:hypothetical protein [Flavitalea sp. BT771]MDO6432929.1 hypothetical protein [Flavitalea sp. BT771]MDV6221795.1 hypothetical protein [Flavitalea sp. BT771]
MKRSWTLVLLVLYCLSNTTLSAQSVIGQPQFDYSPKPPTVAALQKAIDIPVNNYSGSANITIPLHDARSKSIDIPIELGYETSGIKAEQDATVAGLGWVLKAGGMVSRSVRGNPDEGLALKVSRDTILGVPRWASIKDSLANAKNIKGGYYVDGGNNLFIVDYSNAVKDHNQWVTTHTIHDPVPQTSSDWMFYGLNDDAPDMFYFNFGTYSGKFFFGRGRVPILVPYNRDIKIVPTFVSYVDAGKLTNNYFSGWTITTPDGIIYYFGGSNAASGWDNSMAFDGSHVRPNSWALTKIVNTSTRDSVMLDYYTVSSQFNQNTRFQRSFKQQDFNNCIVSGGQVNPNGLCEPRLSSIRTRTEQVNFYYAGGKMDSMVVRDINTQSAYKKALLGFGRFKSGRVKLQEVLLMDYQHAQVLPYTFKYYDTAFKKVRIMIPAPGDSISFSPYAQDFWGYYNDALINEANKSLLLSPSSTCTYGTNRQPAWPQMQRDILTEVTFPTGGRTVFTYEPHTASFGRMTNGQLADVESFYCETHHNFTLDNIIGGLRVKRIDQIDPLKNDTLTMIYDYSSKVFGPARSSGYLHIAPSLMVDVTSGYDCNGNMTNAPKYLLAASNMNTGCGDGLHVTYRNVMVTQDHNGVRNGRTEYEYYDDTNTDSSFLFNICDNVNNSCSVVDLNVLLPWQEKRPYENLLAGNVKSSSIYNNANVLLKQERDSFFSIKYPGLNRVTELSMEIKTDFCDDVGLPAPGQTGRDWVLVPPANSYMFIHTFAIGKMSVLPLSKIVDSYDTTGTKLSDTTRFFYESPYHINQTAVKSTASNKDSLIIQTIYSFDLQNVNGTDSIGMQMKNAFLNVPVANFSKHNDKVVGGGYVRFSRTSALDTTILKREEYRLVTATSVNPGDINLTSTYPKTLSFPVAQFQQVSAIGYDGDNNVSQVVRIGQDTSAYIWGYNSTALVALTTNAASAGVAYTGFESSGNGGWSVPSGSRVSQGITGRKSYALASGSISIVLAQNGRQRVVSYWSLGGSAQVNGATAAGIMTRRGWTYYEHILAATVTNITISGGVTIDELRLYPSGSLMNTYSYDPLLGTTDLTTPDGRTTYYEYDSLQRLRAVKDENGNIRKFVDYRYAGFNTTAPVWRPLSWRLKPCPGNTAYTSDTAQLLYTDLNSRSLTFNSSIWQDTGRCTSCANLVAWVNTATAPRCRLDANGQSVGWQEQEQVDANPCSPTYNTKQWVTVGTYNTVCPVCQGADVKLLRGVCETGKRINTSSAAQTVNGVIKYKCTYHLEWSDCSKSADRFEFNASPCTINLGCDAN